MYYRYDLLNKTIDFGFQYTIRDKPVPNGLMDEIKRICEKIEENTEKILKIISS